LFEVVDAEVVDVFDEVVDVELESDEVLEVVPPAPALSCEPPPILLSPPLNDLINCKSQN
jgi:hypothetical protein